jgi:membrane protein required for colicin V production
MNTFDAVVYFFLALAVVLGYLAAAPVAFFAAPTLAPLLAEKMQNSPWAYWAALGGVFLAAGIVFGALLRLAVRALVGERISVPDRLAGALLGAVRIGLIAVLIVLVFDRLIPPGREPAFLKGSTLRPILSRAGEAGINSLPPEVIETIDRVKRARGF